MPYHNKTQDKIDRFSVAFLDAMHGEGWILTKLIRNGDEIPAFGLGKYKNGARFQPPPVGAAWLAVDGWSLPDGSPRELLINQANVVSFRLNSSVAGVDPVRGQFLLTHEAFTSFIGQFGLANSDDVVIAANKDKVNEFAHSNEFAIEEFDEKIRRQIGGSGDVFRRVLIIEHPNALIVKSLEFGLTYKVKYDLEGWSFIR